MLKDFYDKLSPQEKKFLYAAIIVICLVAFDALFFRSFTSKLKSLDREIEQTRNEIKQDVRFLAYQDKIFKEREAYGKFQTDEQKTAEEVIAAFLKTIENIATESKISLVKLNPGEAASKKGYIEYYALVECNGKLENIVKFIHNIDVTDNLLKVVKMNVVGKKSSADEVTVSLKVAKLFLEPKAESDEKLEERIVPEKAAEVFGNVPGMVPPAGGPAVAGGNDGPGGGARTETGSGGGGDGAGGPGGNSGGAGTDGAQGEGSAGAGKGQGGTGEGAAGVGSGDPGLSAGENTPEGKAAQDAADAQAAQKKGPKAPFDVDEFNKGERLKPKKTLGELWNDFWGIKPQAPKPKRPLTKKEREEKGYQAEDYKPKANLWERLLDKKDGTVPSEEE